MAHSVEARVPFLDHELVEFAAQIPPRLKLRGLNEKAVLREAVSSILPSEIAWRKKRGLRAPLLAWMERPLAPPFHDMMQPSALRRAGIFDPDGVQALLDDHRAGRRNGTYALFSVLVLQLWHEIFERGRGPLL
jgi:asparagine synthase (glutamine-hydrolysing)